MATIEELQALIGKHGGESKFTIDKSMVRLFCDTLGEDVSKWKGVVPPGLMTSAIFVGEGVKMEWPYPGIVDAGADWEFLKPIKVGDELTVVNALSGVEDKSSEKGKRILFSMTSNITNQRGELVIKSTGRIMNLG